MNDVLYIVGKGSIWQNNELKFSLRSLEQHMINYKRVIVVGTLPDFVNPSAVVHIPFEDTHKNKAINIMRKVLRACIDKDLTENLLFMNDDYFLTAPVDAVNYPYCWKNTLKDAMAKNIHEGEYYKHLIATHDELNKRAKPLYNFDGHCPIVYNRKQMAAVIDEYDWNIKYGFVLRSLYCNTLFIKGQYKQDVKLNISRFEKQIYECIQNTDCFSIGDKAINKSLHTVMKELYPNKSKFEK